MTAIDAPIEAAPSRFEIGRVVGISLGELRRRWGTVVPLALIVWAIAVAQSLAHFAQYKHGSHDLRAFANYWAFAIAFVCIGWLKDAAIVTAALADHSETRPLSHALQGAVRVFLPLLPYHVLAAGPALLWNAWSSWSLTGPPGRVVAVELASGGVFWLYGLVLTACFGLVTPTALVERGGLIASLRRSAGLLSGGRWRFLGLSILMDFVGAVPATFGGVLVAFAMTRMPVAEDAHVLARYSQTEAVVTGLLASLVTALWLVMTAISYKEFRRLREGAPHDQLAAIFS